ARWAAPLLRARPGRRLATSLTTASPRRDVSRREALDRAGVDGLLRATLDSFFAGVVLEDDGSTSQAYALLLTATFLAGTPALPEHGMQALPAQLAGRLGDRVRLGTAVDSVETVAGGAVVHAGGTTLRARQVVVAVAGQDAGALTGPDAEPTPRTKGVVTSWFAADEAPTDSHLLFVDGRSRPSGPLVNTAVVSNPAPSYAPAGQHLVQASALLGPDRLVPTEDDVRRHAGELLGADPRGWRLLHRHEVPHALPAQPAPLALRRPVRLRDHLVVCGDHRDTASIQGALVSGQRAALDDAAVLD
ncbi:FAD-dependent oxidoreductase, partial [Nocardioides aquaticus]|uniref:FAD-dependent oxidoreductase n=1 Tax=Nocardioides aquaticus TaxID=160826 RepID=UPI0031DF5FF2